MYSYIDKKQYFCIRIKEESIKNGKHNEHSK